MYWFKLKYSKGVYVFTLRRGCSVTGLRVTSSASVGRWVHHLVRHPVGNLLASGVGHLRLLYVPTPRRVRTTPSATASRTSIRCSIDTDRSSIESNLFS